ncbi:hypothetical protein [Brevundimonas sp.]|uniref:hypothetical protein n=1 Tax=Brevundimonas sp. TaxID=1871086 RepID=UPI00248A7EEE|nr:hypothetical protein [Brevundimonas sp.]MDI1280528.1 hypothetical protein [Brevundimonas sp.]
MHTALVVAHPGHELRMSAWVRRARPRLSIIARGSRSGQSERRIEASRRLADVLGAVPTAPFGAAFDVDLYRWMMAGDAAPFLDLVDTLAAGFCAGAVTTVVTDGWQNYNPVHDLTHLMTRVAAAEAGQTLGRAVTCLDYPVVLGDLAAAPAGPAVAVLDLDPQQRADKQALVDRYPEIADDVASLSASAGPAAFTRESLHRPLPLADLIPTDRPPLYEAWGEDRVRAGVYAEALRWSHMVPIVSRLARRLEAAG